MMIKEYSTVKRDKILQFLKTNSERAVSVPDIMDFLKDENMDMNKTSVYRYLDRLMEQNQLLKFVSDKGNMTMFQYMGDERECYDHLHIQCVRCKKVSHMKCEYMNQIHSHIEEHHGYELLYRNSVLYGICKECSETGGIS